MIYPKNIEEKLGFDQVRNLLKEHCLSSLGQDYADKMNLCFDAKLVTKLSGQAWEFKEILEREMLFPSSSYFNMLPHLDKIAIEGSLLEPSTFYEFKLSLYTISRCLEFFKQKEEFPNLKELGTNVDVPQYLRYSLEEIIDDNGNVKDSASDELKKIRKSLIETRSSLRRELDGILRNLKKEGYSAEDVEITIRNGRMVVPVLAEHKRKVKGFIHDESATGQTVFLEPARVFDLNNELRELEYMEKREITRILIKLTDSFRPELPVLRLAYQYLGKLDFIRAKAKLGILFQCIRPEIEAKPLVKWIEARHPLLELSLKKQLKSVVPLSISLDEEKRILVISGPNAGGKSVCLKTLGLLQYMLQTGLLVPVKEGSVFGIFKDFFIDIGDEQSIENDLSTYSSHLKGMKYFIDFSRFGSLILIDEFGSGTEPQAGAAIAESVLDTLNMKNVFGVITTHYTNLKNYASKTAGIENAAMLFDVNELTPLYELSIGLPGSSFAFEIAGKTGLSKDLLNTAREKTGKENVIFEELLRELEAEKLRARKTSQKVAEKEKELEKQLQKYNDLSVYLETNKKSLIREAKEEAKKLVLDANQKIENTIREIRETQAEKTRTRQLRDELKDIVKEEEGDTKEFPIIKEEGQIQEKDYVMITDTGVIGEVIKLTGKDAEIVIGGLTSKIKLNRLQKISRNEYRKHVSEEKISTGTGINLNEKLGNFNPSIDVRGKRGEEALSSVDDLLDSAILFGATEVRVVHGKGDGILRTLIRNHLKNYTQVVSVADEHADRGGAGVTVIKMK